MAGFSGATGVPFKQMQDAIAQSTAYASGNSETFGNASIGAAGFVTSGSQQMNFFVPLPKSLTNISSITCTRFTGLIRGNSGYVNNVSDSSTNWVGMSGMTVTVQKSGTNMVRIILASSSALANVTNNTPLHAFALITLNFS